MNPVASSVIAWLVLAAEPEVANPIAMAWDARGRLWIAENFTDAEPGIRFETRLGDRVVVFTDRDHVAYLMQPAQVPLPE